MGQKLSKCSPFDTSTSKSRQIYIKRPVLISKVRGIFSDKNCCIIGAPGAGKTSFIEEFAKECTSCLVVRFSGDDYTPIRSAATGESTLSRFTLTLIEKFYDATNEREGSGFDRLASSLDSYWRILRKRKEPSTLEHIGEIGRRLYSNMPQEIIPVVALDDFDQSAYFKPDTVRALLDGLLVLEGESQKKIKLLLTTTVWPDNQWFKFEKKEKRSEIRDLDGQIEYFWAGFSCVSLPWFTRDKTIQIGNQGLEELCKNCSCTEQQRVDLGNLFGCYAPDIQKQSGGHPLLVKKLYHHLLEQCDDEGAPLRVDWDKVKQAARRDVEIKRLVARMHQTLSREQEAVVTLVETILQGDWPSDLKRTVVMEELPLRRLPSTVKVGRLEVEIDKELQSFVNKHIKIARQATPTERDQKSADLIWVGEQAYYQNALLIWELCKDFKALRREYSAGERVASWLVDHYPDWPLIQVLYFSFLFYFGLWTLLTFLDAQRWRRMALLLLVPFLLYLLWTIVYGLLRRRRE